MNWMKNQWALLRKYGFTFSMVLQTSISIYFFVRAFMAEDAIRSAYYASFGVMFLMMDLLDIVTANLRNERDICKAELDNVKDKLVVAEHDVERLTLELEVTQAALQEAKKRKEYSGYVQTGLVQVEVEGKTASIDTAETAVANAASADIPEAKPKPKRPAFKRKPKPKQTENVNENKG